MAGTPDAGALLMPGSEPTGPAPPGTDPARCPREPPDRGAVTVEAALALCTLAVFLALALGAITAVATSVRCIDAARELARLAARGEPDRGRAVALQLAPDGAQVELVRDGDSVIAQVSVQLLHPLPLRVDGRAVAVVEPGAVVQ